MFNTEQKHIENIDITSIFSIFDIFSTLQQPTFCQICPEVSIWTNVNVKCFEFLAIRLQHQELKMGLLCFLSVVLIHTKAG